MDIKSQDTDDRRAPQQAWDWQESQPSREAQSTDSSAKPRFQRAERRQIEWRPLALDELLPDDHTARLVWAYVEKLDLTPLYDRIRAVEGHVGRSPIDPKILVALWLYATIDGCAVLCQAAGPYLMRSTDGCCAPPRSAIAPVSNS